MGSDARRGHLRIIGIAFLTGIVVVALAAGANISPVHETCRDKQPCEVCRYGGGCDQRAGLCLDTCWMEDDDSADGHPPSEVCDFRCIRSLDSADFAQCPGAKDELSGCSVARHDGGAGGGVASVALLIAAGQRRRIYRQRRGRDARCSG